MKQYITDYRELCKIIQVAYHSQKIKKYVVAIGGCSRTGKSILAGCLSKCLKRSNIASIIVPLDNWIISLEKRKPEGTVRQRYESHKIVHFIEEIKKGKAAFHPKYNSKTRKRVAERSKKPLRLNKGILIVEGVVALDIKGLRKLSNLRIFVELDDKKRIERLVKFYRGHKKCSLSETQKIISSREKDEVLIIKKTKKYADIIYCQ